MICGFLAIRFNLTNVSGAVDSFNQEFQKNDSQAQVMAQTVKGEETSRASELDISNIEHEIERLSKVKDIKAQNYCKIKVTGIFYPANAKKIIEISESTKSDSIIAKAIMAVNLRMSKDPMFPTEIAQCEKYAAPVIDFSELKDQYENVNGDNCFAWIDKPEWQAIKEAVKKDKNIIDQVGEETGIEPRLIVSNMIVEQLRLFYSEREVFKKFFEPLKILCSANKISLGVMGIKEATAMKVEENLKDSQSGFYLGKDFENKLDFNTGDVTAERYNRLTDDKNHYYSYLYGALYLKQMMKQWEDAGYSINYRPEIIGTLFNVGFPQSRPNANPKVGGSHINVGGVDYSFGALAYEFYYSGELLDEFPYQLSPRTN